MSQQQEKIGVIFALTAAAMWGIFPVVVNRGTQTIPPIMFAAITTLLAAFGSLVYAIVQGKLHELRQQQSYASLLMITLCIVIIPYILFFIGSSQTSGINSSLLLLAEIIFTLLFTPLVGEKTTKKKLIGAIGVFLGAGLILYNGTFALNTGDLLIILSTATYPIGNFYAKKALNYVSPAIILFVRFLLGGVCILGFSLLMESQARTISVFVANWEIILFTGLISLGVGKVVWYEGLKRLDISKAISLSMTFPVFSLLVLVVFFQEVPSIYQLGGLVVMGIGVYFAIQRSSTDPATTSYAS